jgi:hypothetical protein
MQLANSACPIAEIRQMVNLYFPLDPSADAAPLFCRVIQGLYLEDAVRLREEVLGWVNGADEAHR